VELKSKIKDALAKRVEKRLEAFAALPTEEKTWQDCLRLAIRYMIYFNVTRDPAYRMYGYDWMAQGPVYSGEWAKYFIRRYRNDLSEAERAYNKMMDKDGMPFVGLSVIATNMKKKAEEMRNERTARSA